MSLSTKKIIGTLVPVSSLRSDQQNPEDYGTFETGLYFLEWLKKTRQSAWQILPLNETQLEKYSSTKHVPSPYKGYGIGLDPRYLTKGEGETDGTLPSPRVSAGTAKETEAIEKFVTANEYWIHDYALFCALRDHYGTDDWREWESGLRTRKKDVIELWSQKLEKQIDGHITIQWKLHKSYGQLRNKAKKNGILLIGDLPFYVSVKSPLVWVHQDIFQFEKDGSLRYVSGCPDTPSAHFGRQIWGHPLFRWKSHTEIIIKFWEIRLKYLSLLFDSIRFDHAKGFFDYGEIDLTNDSNDKYIKGPGLVVFEELLSYGKKHGLSIFAEDSGEHLTEVRNSLEKLKIPGIKILRFALNEKKKRINEEYAYVSKYPKLTVAYTTTHDTETLLGYLGNLSTEQKIMLSNAAEVKYIPEKKKLAKRLRDAVIGSPAEIIIIPIQDWLLTNDRINIPGTEQEVDDPNWRYRVDMSIEKLPQL